VAFLLYTIVMTEEIVTQVKQATDYQKNKQVLREKIVAELHMPFEGGLFHLTPSLMAFVETWPQEDLFLEDVYSNPIPINRQKFMNLARERYQSVMNDWHIKHLELKSVRKV
jgi:hypothetical protein